MVAAVVEGAAVAAVESVVAVAVVQALGHCDLVVNSHRCCCSLCD